MTSQSVRVVRDPQLEGGAELGPPAIGALLSPFFFGGGQKKVGALILTSLLEDLDTPVFSIPSHVKILSIHRITHHGPHLGVRLRRLRSGCEKVARWLLRAMTQLCPGSSSSDSKPTIKTG